MLASLWTGIREKNTQQNTPMSLSDIRLESSTPAEISTEMELPETHVIILIVAGVGLALVLLYEMIRIQLAKCRGTNDDDDVEAKTSSCQKLEEPPPSYESLFP